MNKIEMFRRQEEDYMRIFGNPKQPAGGQDELCPAEQYLLSETPAKKSADYPFKFR